MPTTRPSQRHRHQQQHPRPATPTSLQADTEGNSAKLELWHHRFHIDRCKDKHRRPQTVDAEDHAETLLSSSPLSSPHKSQHIHKPPAPVPPAGVNSKDDAINMGNDAEHHHHPVQKSLNLRFSPELTSGMVGEDSTTTARRWRPRTSPLLALVTTRGMAFAHHCITPPTTNCNPAEPPSTREARTCPDPAAGPPWLSALEQIRRAPHHLTSKPSEQPESTAPAPPSRATTTPQRQNAAASAQIRAAGEKKRPGMPHSPPRLRRSTPRCRSSPCRRSPQELSQPPQEHAPPVAAAHQAVGRRRGRKRPAATVRRTGFARRLLPATARGRWRKGWSGGGGG